MMGSGKKSETKGKELSLTPEDVELLNSSLGLKNLFYHKETNVAEVLAVTRYQIEFKKLQTELIKLQNWVIDNKKKVVVLFEGRDAAGKGGTINRIVSHINPRHFKVVALPKPTSEEAGQWYFQRYVNQLPKPGQIVFFDRSWYNRAVIEPVYGFCTQEQYQIFMGQVNDFERMVMESDTILIKIYFSITKEEQARRFEEIKSSPLKIWKLTPVDEKAQELWDDFTAYKQKMLKTTHTEKAPWLKIDANDKFKARIEALGYILSRVPYNKIEGQ